MGAAGACARAAGLPETELYAVCTAHADTAQAAADKFGVTGAYGSDKALDADKRGRSGGGRGARPAHYDFPKTP